MYHIAAEITLFGGLFYYVSKKNNDLRQKLYEIEQDIEDIAESDGSSNFNKVSKLQDKFKEEFENVQTIKKQLSRDVKDLQLAREQHNQEQKQIQQTFEERIRELQQKRDELAIAQQKHQDDVKKLKDKELTLNSLEQSLKMKSQTVPMHPIPIQPVHQPFNPYQSSSVPMHPIPIQPVPQPVHQPVHQASPSMHMKHTQVHMQNQPFQQELEPVLKQDPNPASNQDDQEVELDPYEPQFDEIDDEIDAELELLEQMDSNKFKRSKSKSKSRARSKSKSKR